MNQPDNLEIQPRTGIYYVIEDTPSIDWTGDGVRESHPGEVWACLPDGKDDNLLTDGCVRVVSVATQGSEPTGFIFEASGKKAYLNVQHSPDDPSTPAVDEGTSDEMLEIRGFVPKEALKHGDGNKGELQRRR
jgi:secreted PhoX family phosphatase